MTIEYPDVEERKLGELVGIEYRIWVQVAGAARVYAIADEDLERATDEKTSAVHFLRFELDRNMIGALRTARRSRWAPIIRTIRRRSTSTRPSGRLF